MTKSTYLLRAVDELLGAAESYARSQLVKAALPKTMAERKAMLVEAASEMASELSGYFHSLASRLRATIAKAEPIDWDPTDAIDWTVADSELSAILVRWWTNIGEEAFAAISEQIGVEVRFDLKSEGVAALLDRIGTRVVGINESSRQALAAAVGRAADQGLSVDELARSISDMVGSWASTPEGGIGARSWSIAATETATAYNEASTTGYRESGLVEEVLVFDGPECGWTEHDDPDLADGSTRTLDEADEYPISHPNCQRAFGPVVAQ